MSRILCIDYGKKRCGVAVTDVLQIAANGLPTVETKQLLAFLKEYCSREDVSEIVVGKPTQLDGRPSENMCRITPFLGRLKKELPGIQVVLFDERFTSTIAHREMIAAGLKRSTRQQKALADKTAAVLILTDYLQSRSIRFS